MVFRKDTKVDAFQRQISALRQQLGDGEGEGPPVEAEPRREPDRGYEPVGYVHRESRPSPSFAVAPDDFAPVETEPPAYSASALDRQTSVIAHDTVWTGDLQTNGTVHVHGRVEGSVTARHDVFVADEAEVSASIVAENVAVAGLVRGTVRCGNRFEVLPQGRVAGDVFAPVLVVHEGATINGQFKMTEVEDVIPASTVAASLRRRAARSGS
ncbi:MAG: polymer-forming cytoskeletal protein [Chloroflexia bacterium]|nr:polymer-forming cytoskeletal protein [Chloroflexia bacterium]